MVVVVMVMVMVVVVVVVSMVREEGHCKPVIRELCYFFTEFSINDGTGTMSWCPRVSARYRGELR